NCNPLLFTCAPVFLASVGGTTAPATPPVIDGGKVFVAGADVLAAFDPTGQSNCTTALGTATCTPLWSATTGLTVEGVGPAAESGAVVAAVDTGTAPGIRSFDEATGAVRWTGPLAAAPTATPSIGPDAKVWVPTGGSIQAFVGNGCGAATGPAPFALTGTGGAPAAFRPPPTVDGSRLFATSTDGRLTNWSANGCGSATCTPTSDLAVDTPSGGATDYRQQPVITGGIVFLLVHRDVSDTDHLFLVALDENDSHEIA